MTFDEILEILKSAKTDYQKAADLHAAVQTATRPSALTLQPQKTKYREFLARETKKNGREYPATRPSALTLQPQKTRKPRTATPKPKTPASDSLNGFAGHVDNEGSANV